LLTHRKTNKQTKTGKNITSLAEVIRSVFLSTNNTSLYCVAYRRQRGQCDSRLEKSSKSYSSSSPSVCQFSTLSCCGAATVRVTQLPVLAHTSHGHSHDNDNTTPDIMPSARGASVQTEPFVGRFHNEKHASNCFNTGLCT